MKRVFLDTNVLLDALETSRERHADAKTVLQLAASGRIEAVVSAQSLLDLAYIYTKGQKVRLAQLKTLLPHLDRIFTVRETTRRTLLMAASHFTDDLEDAAQAFIAADAGCELIVTSDRTFDDPFGLPLVSPDAFCKEFFDE